jgi:hypothetical protein
VSCSYPIYDFCLWRGEDKELFFSFSYTEQDGTTTSMKLDNCRFEMLLTVQNSQKVIDSLTSESGRLVPGIIEDGGFSASDINATVLQVLFPHEITAQLWALNVVYELFKIDSANKREMLLAGTIDVHGGGYV